jgi:hypothetical protein
MLTLNLTARDVALSISREFSVPIGPERPVRELISYLVDQLEWPQAELGGQPIHYVLMIIRGNAPVYLTGDEMIKAVGFMSGDVVTLGPLGRSITPLHGPGPVAGVVADPGDWTSQQSAPWVMKPLRSDDI